MTAFSRTSQLGEWGQLSWEIRSVNHRYLELNLFLPEGLKSFEADLRELARSMLQRGKVDCTLRYIPQSDELAHFELNRPLLKALLCTVEQVNEMHPKIQGPIDPLRLLQWPGVLSPPTTESAALKKPILSCATLAFEELLKARQREGAAIAQALEQRLGAIDVQLALLEAQLPVILQTQRLRLQQRFHEMDLEPDPIRFEQEIGLLVQKADVSEEFDRLKAHVAEMRRLINEGGPIGRRLDFLLQELQREANTLSSKSIHLDSTQIAVELKVLIEQMREQAQNVE